MRPHAGTLAGSGRARQEDQRNKERKGDGQQQEIVDVGKHGGLAGDHAADLRLGQMQGLAGGAAEARHVLLDRASNRTVARVTRGDPVDQHAAVILLAPGKKGRKQRDADASSQISREVDDG
jgi:hypothetical protein